MILPLRLEGVAFQRIIQPISLQIEAGPSTALNGSPEEAP